MSQEAHNVLGYQCTTCRREFFRHVPDGPKRNGRGIYCSTECWYTRNKDQKCSVDGCDVPPRGKGLCPKHYSRQRRHGDPNITIHEANGSPNIKRYRKKRIGERRVTEHRWVVEQVLGRRLRPEESVHHKDGNKLNNDPGNLMLFPTIAAHRQYENRYREYLEMCLRDGYLVWAETPPPFNADGCDVNKLAA